MFILWAIEISPAVGLVVGVITALDVCACLSGKLGKRPGCVGRSVGFIYRFLRTKKQHLLVPNLVQDLIRASFRMLSAGHFGPNKCCFLLLIGAFCFHGYDNCY